MNYFVSSRKNLTYVLKWKSVMPNVGWLDDFFQPLKKAYAVGKTLTKEREYTLFDELIL